MIEFGSRLFGEQAFEEGSRIQKPSRVASDCKPFGPGEEPFVLGRCSLKRTDIELSMTDHGMLFCVPARLIGLSVSRPLRRGQSVLVSKPREEAARSRRVCRRMRVTFCQILTEGSRDGRSAWHRALGEVLSVHFTEENVAVKNVDDARHGNRRHRPGRRLT
jgi:hypothetical protein